MTAIGKRKLEQQLEDLESELADVLLEKADAAQTGGNVWHDNFAFEDCERRERALHVKIRKLRGRLSRAVLVPSASGNNEQVAIGSTVVIEFDDGTERTISIGGHGESDPNAGLVSCDSPLGKAVLNAATGEARSFRVRDRKRTVTVMELK